MVKLKVKKGDNVVVISGKDRGKTGKITQIIPAQNRAVVEGVNIIIKHQKPQGNKQKGGIIKKSAPMQISNLMVVCPVCGKATRVAKKEISDKLSRICKKCGAGLDKEYVKVVKKDQKKKETSKDSVTEKTKPTKDETLKEKAQTKQTEVSVEKAEASTEKVLKENSEEKKAVKTEAKTTEKASKGEKTVKTAQSGKTVKSAPKTKTKDEQVKKISSQNVGRTTTIRKSTNRGK